MKNTITLFFLLLFSISLSAQETLRAMFYNLWDFPSARIENRDVILKRIIEPIDPDIFMVCELESEEGGIQILNALNSINNEYAMAPFFPSASGDFDHQQLIFYKKRKFNLEYSEALPTEVRDINYYNLKLNTADGDVDPLNIHVFVTHLKSSQGTANRQARLDMVETFIAKTETLDSNSFVLFSGDFNLYTHTEPAFQRMIDPDNHITMADPANRIGNWHENRNFIDVHTQSTRASSTGFGGGAGGGVDDRFDFIMMSSNMQDNPKLMYTPDTYKAYGNNGSCYKLSINDPSCDGFYGQELRDDLYYMSDHLPVIMDMTTNKEVVLSTNDFVYHQNPIILHATVVNQNLEITINLDFDFGVEFEIYNVLGQKVLAESFKNRNRGSIDVSTLSSGIYYLKSNIPNGPTLKFIKSS